MMKTINSIQDQFNEVIRYSQNIENPKTDRLFKEWYSSKKHFIDKWGGLTVELPNVSVSIDREAKKMNVEDFGRACSINTGNRAAATFIWEQGVDAFYENRVKEDFWLGDKKISKGMKISRALKFFTDDKAVLDRLQTHMSRLIQDAKLTGTLVMSVHPLDFLSSSENAHNWRSCHALDGEYRAGNLSYMQDEHTFICYLKSEKEAQLPNFPFAWNSKKWRVLMHARADKKVIMSGKQYPFESKELLDILFNDLISKQYEDNWSSEWLKPPVEHINRMMIDALGSMQFNDCLFSSSYRPVVRYSMDLQDNLHEDFINPKNTMSIGDAIECLACGHGMVSLSESMLCNECGGYSHCDCCGETVSPDCMYEINGDYLCENCYDELISYCYRCDNPVDTRVEEMMYDDINDEFYCECCYAEIEQEREFERADEESVEGLL